MMTSKVDTQSAAPLSEDNTLAPLAGGGEDNHPSAPKDDQESLLKDQEFTDITSGLRSENRDRLLTALLDAPSITAAAKVAGVSRQTAHKYLRDPQFQREYRELRHTQLERGLSMLQTAVPSAVAVCIEIMTSTDAMQGNRLTAAKSVLAWADKLTASMDFAQQLEELEDE